jgi:hypothetical protein
MIASGSGTESARVAEGNERGVVVLFQIGKKSASCILQTIEQFAGNAPAHDKHKGRSDGHFLLKHQQWTSCGTPLSRISKSDFFRPDMGLPLSVTRTSNQTSSAAMVNMGFGAAAMSKDAKDSSRQR